MDNVNPDSDVNIGTKRHEPCMHRQSWELRFYPCDAQKQGLAQWFGHARWAWSTGLNMRSKAWARRRENVTGVDVAKKLTEMKQRIPWLSNVPVSCLQQALRDQDKAFKSFFEGLSKYPKFKSKFRKQSARVTIDARHGGKAQAWRSGSRKLPELGTVKLKGRKLPKAMPKMITIVRIQQAVLGVRREELEAHSVDEGLDLRPLQHQARPGRERRRQHRGRGPQTIWNTLREALRRGLAEEPRIPANARLWRNGARTDHLASA